MTGERNMIRDGYRWDVIAHFASNTAGVRVGTRKTKRGAERFAARFTKINRGFGCRHTHVKLRHDVLLDRLSKRGAR